jgi:hypothetical protein
MPPVPKKVTERSLCDAEEQNVEGPLIGWCRTKHIEPPDGKGNESKHKEKDQGYHQECVAINQWLFKESLPAMEAEKAFEADRVRKILWIIPSTVKINQTFYGLVV